MVWGALSVVGQLVPLAQTATMLSLYIVCALAPFSCRCHAVTRSVREEAYASSGNGRAPGRVYHAHCFDVFLPCPRSFPGVDPTVDTPCCLSRCSHTGLGSVLWPYVLLHEAFVNLMAGSLQAHAMAPTRRQEGSSLLGASCDRDEMLSSYDVV